MHKTFNERSQREDTSLYIISISYALIGVPSHSFAEKKLGSRYAFGNQDMKDDEHHAKLCSTPFFNDTTASINHYHELNKKRLPYVLVS